eukprot:363483-Prymnesium_polylepis.2
MPLLAVPNASTIVRHVPLWMLLMREGGAGTGGADGSASDGGGGVGLEDGGGGGLGSGGSGGL